jgi:hypothetical protein
MLSFVRPSVIFQNIFAPSVTMLSVVRLSVMALKVVAPKTLVLTLENVFNLRCFYCSTD